MNTFPVAPELPKELKDLITKLGKLWAEDPKRPQPKRSVLQHWKKLISDWADDDSLPLYVRKKSDRGAVVSHFSGRSLVPTDNSPAQWAYVQSYRGCKPSLKDIAKMVNGDQVPIAMVLTRQERKKAEHTYLLKEFDNESINSAGWYLAHIEPVRLNGKLTKLDISAIKKHFVRLMSPSNMFVVPTKYAGLAGLPEFCEQIMPKSGRPI
ncbi:MAG: hypothetical protein ACLP5V_05695 [Candidatus Bathyarchaeia archaeon]